MITQKLNYKTLIKNVKFIIIIFFLFVLNSCKKNEIIFKENSKETLKDSLILLKDTISFEESSQGQEIKLFLDYNKKDSIIIIENYGETSKEISKFLFNINLISAENKIIEYKEPISVNAKPIVKKEIIKRLSSSNDAKNELIQSYSKYKNLFINDKINKFFLKDKWTGNYSSSINENSEDWRDTQDISLKISNDSIIYKVEGYQIYQLYKLRVKEENNNSLKLEYDKSLDNTQSAVLNKTKDFGEILFDGRNYKWNSPYLDISFMNGKKTGYNLKKHN